MQPELLARVIALVQQHGERMVLIDQETGDGVVVLDLASYEQLLAASGASADTKYVPESTHARSMSQPRRIPSSMLSEAEVIAQVGEPLTKVVRKKPVTMRQDSSSPDLTQGELLDKINRDIGAWKTAQEQKRTSELRSVVGKSPRSAQPETLEDEERFYLEPIE